MGGTIDLEQISIYFNGINMQLVSVQQEIMAISIKLSSLNTRIVTRVVPESHEN